jgi:hypothetical protein
LWRMWHRYVPLPGSPSWTPFAKRL